MTEYALNIYEGDKFLRQVDVFNTYEEAQDYADENPLDDGYCYSIWCIEYDANGEEAESYPVY